MVVVVDMDATLANASARYARAGMEPAREDKDAYLAWLTRVQSEATLRMDKPNAGVLEMIQMLANAGAIITYVTAREEIYREVTAQWLWNVQAPRGGLHMRARGDYRSMPEVKKEKLRMILDEYPEHQVVALDDDPRGEAASMYAALGINHFKYTNNLLEAGWLK